MNSIEETERALMADPTSKILQGILTALYERERGMTAEEAKDACLAIWHPHWQAQFVTHAALMLCPTAVGVSYLRDKIRDSAGVHPDETYRVILCPGDLPPQRANAPDDLFPEKLDATILVFAEWVIRAREQMMEATYPPTRSRPKRRRW